MCARGEEEQLARLPQTWLGIGSGTDTADLLGPVSFQAGPGSRDIGMLPRGYTYSLFVKLALGLGAVIPRRLASLRREGCPCSQ